jgi:hypothetical protein
MMEGKRKAPVLKLCVCVEEKRREMMHDYIKSSRRD